MQKKNICTLEELRGDIPTTPKPSGEVQVYAPQSTSKPDPFTVIPMNDQLRKLYKNMFI